MPKNKTHRGAAKRVKVSGTGRLLRQHAGRRHNFERKPSTLTRRLEGTTEVSKADSGRLRRLLRRR